MFLIAVQDREYKKLVTYASYELEVAPAYLRIDFAFGDEDDGERRTLRVVGVSGSSYGMGYDKLVMFSLKLTPTHKYKGQLSLHKRALLILEDLQGLVILILFITSLLMVDQIFQLSDLQSQKKYTRFGSTREMNTKGKKWQYLKVPAPNVILFCKK